MGDDYKKIASVFLLVGVIGGAVTLLYASKSGREARKDIARKAKRIKKETVHLVEETIDSIKDFATNIKDKVTDVLEMGRALSDSTKNEIVWNLEHGQKVIEKQKKRVIEALGL